MCAAIALCLAPLANAQITGIATNGDGSALYFSTPLNLAGPGETSAVKIFRYDGSGFHLYASQFPAPEPRSGVLSNPWVSGDGSLVAFRSTYSLSQLCGFMEMCWHTYTQTALMSATATPVILNEAAILSANGRYALLPTPALLDLATGTQTAIPMQADYEPPLLWSVASNGAALLSDPWGNALYLWSGSGGLRAIAGANTGAAMDDLGLTVVYSNGFTLFLYDVASGASRVFANGAAPAMSSDGKWVAFLSPVNGVAQAWAVPADGSEFIQLTDEPAGVTAVAISGDGTAVFAATAASAIWKYALPAGTGMLAMPATAAPQYPQVYASVIGSISTLPVTGLVTETVTATPPLPTTLAGYQVLIGGTPAPVLSISPAAIAYQIPWETPLYSVPIQLKPPDANPLFEAATGMLFVASFMPMFQSSTYILATHADGTPVTVDQPAHPGEVLYLPLVGMGAVTPAVADGAAAPANPPAMVQHPFACQAISIEGPAGPYVLGDLTMLAVELTPGAVGAYQAKVEMPLTTGPDPSVFIYCQGSDYYAPGRLPVVPSTVF